MNQDPKFTESLQAWMNTPDAQKNWDEGAILLLQLSGNRIMYRNISVNPKGKAEFIKGQLQKYLNFRLQKLTHDQVADMQTKVDDIVKNVIKPAGKSEIDVANKSEEFADFKAGKRPDHDDLPEEIQALYVENLDIVHRMRELHLKLRTLSLDNATCPDSERYPFLKEIINLDREITQEVPACMTPDSFAAGDEGPTRGAELCSQCEIVVSFSVSFERVLFTWITATARLSLFHTPVETFTPPQVMKSGRLICRSTILYDCALLSILCAKHSTRDWMSCIY